MATKTFKTRIKLKYDLQSAWNSNFSALHGELLLGKDNATPNKVFANVGTEDGIKPLSIFTNNVWVDDTTTLATKLTAIDTALGTGGSVDTKIANAINALNVPAFQLASIDNDSETESKIYIKKIEEENGIIKPVEDNTFSVNIDGKYNAENNKLATESTVSTVVTNAQNTLQGNIDTLSGTVAGYGTRLGNVEGVAGSALQNANGDTWISASKNGTALALTHNTPVAASGITGRTIEITGVAGAAVEASIPFNVFDTTGHKNGDGNHTLSIKFPSLEEMGITGAMHFKGKKTSLPESTEGYKDGDVILVGSKEYVCSNDGWVELGDEGSYALKTVKAIAGDGLTGGGTLAADFTISHGTTTVVTAAAIKVGRDQYGHVTTGDALKASDIACDDSTNVQSAIDTVEAKAVANEAAITKLNGDVNTEGSVKNSIKTAIEGLDSNATIATEAGDIVTLNTTIHEVDGKLTTSTGAIALAKVAKTGTATDVSMNNTGHTIITKNNVQGAIDDTEAALREHRYDITTNTNEIRDLKNLVGDTAVATQITNAIGDLDNNGETIASVNNDGVVTLSKTIKQNNGVIDIEATNNTITLKKVSTTGKISDLEQAESQTVDGLTNTVDMIIFDCGSATENTVS